MGNYEQLKRAISNVIKTNGNQKITGEVLQNSLLSIISTIGNNATFAGVATPVTNPGTPDANIFYIASTVGTYPNFNALKIEKGEIAIFANNGNVWKKHSIAIQNNDDLPLYNVDYNVPLSQGYYDKIRARISVPISIRKIGLVITYKTDETTSVLEQFVGPSIDKWNDMRYWVQYEDTNKASGKFIDYIAKPDYVPDLSKLNVGDYFITDLFDCILSEKFIDNSGRRIQTFYDSPVRLKIVFNSNNRFDCIASGKANLKKMKINFISKRYDINGISFTAFIGGISKQFDFSLKYNDAYEEFGITSIYWSSIVVYYDMKTDTIKYKAYSVDYRNSDTEGFSDIDLYNQVIIAIHRRKGNSHLVSNYFVWQYQSPKSNLILSEINEHTCDLKTVEDFLGTSYEFRTVIYLNMPTVELTDYQNSYWVLGAKTRGTKVISNMLYNGSPITIECKDQTVYLISIGASGSNYSVTELTKFIGNSFWCTVLFKGGLSLSTGTYICFGYNSLSYSENIPNSVTGVSKKTTKIIFIHPEGYESKFHTSGVRAIIRNISCYNAYPDTRHISSINIDNCIFEFDEYATKQSDYILNFSNGQDGSIVVKSTDFIAHGAVYTFLYLNSRYIEIEGCLFKARSSSHPVRINEALGYCFVKGNKVINGKTGIFVGSTRLSLIKNIVIESNTVTGCNEESISLDCFGNNTALCPVIAKSYIDTFETDESERTTTINLKYLYYVEKADRGYRAVIEEASFFDPLKFLFIICNGEHKYSIFEPISAEQIYYTGESGSRTTYRIKLKGYLPNLQNNDEVGFYSGFYNCVIRNNVVNNAGNNKDVPGHGISIWGGGYCCKIEGNVLYSCNNGIQMNGFCSFGVYEPAMFNYSLFNTIRNNIISDCKTALKLGAVYIPSVGYEYLRDAYTSIIGNTLLNNGESRIYYTEFLLVTSNIFDRSIIKTENCTNELKINNIDVQNGTNI